MIMSWNVINQQKMERRSQRNEEENEVASFDVNGEETNVVRFLVFKLKRIEPNLNLNFQKKNYGSSSLIWKHMYQSKNELDI